MALALSKRGQRGKKIVVADTGPKYRPSNESETLALRSTSPARDVWHPCHLGNGRHLVSRSRAIAAVAPSMVTVGPKRQTARPATAAMCLRSGTPGGRYPCAGGKSASAGGGVTAVTSATQSGADDAEDRNPATHWRWRSRGTVWGGSMTRPRGGEEAKASRSRCQFCTNRDDQRNEHGETTRHDASLHGLGQAALSCD